MNSDLVVVVIRVGKLFLEDALPTGILHAGAALAAGAPARGSPGFDQPPGSWWVHTLGNRRKRPPRNRGHFVIGRGVRPYVAPREHLGVAARPPPASGCGSQGAECVEDFAERRQLQSILTGYGFVNHGNYQPPLAKWIINRQLDNNNPNKFQVQYIR